MSLSFANSITVQGRARALVPLCVGAGAYLFFMYVGDTLLQDSDSFWQIKIGQWIIDHGAMPYTDIYSFTRTGAPWISTSWLSQVLFALSYAQLGWAGPVILTATGVALTAAIFVYLLDLQIEAPRAVLFAMLALLLSLHHVLARPHILALPVMVAWVGLLIAAADRRSAPSWYWLPVMALWANLHGGFVLGLALIGPVGLEAIWSSDLKHRFVLASQWSLFALAALGASCCTPYGWSTLLGAAKILSLGKLLSLIWEWMPADFSSISFFEAALLGLIGLAFYRRLVLSVPRIILLLGLIWMALTHSRNIEVFAFLAPLVLAKPIAEQWRTAEAGVRPFGEIQPPYHITIIAALA